MENNIYIHSETIANYVMFKLDKIDNKFTKEELEQITEINIDYKLDNNIYLMKDILLFKNIKSLNIKNGTIYNKDLEILLKLEKLNEITFEKCNFENADLLASLNLKSLSLINCNINNYMFISTIKKLEELSIIRGNVNISNINHLKNLTYLQLSYSIINDDITSINLGNIRELYIDNTNIIDLSFVKYFNNLTKLSIDENQYKNNKEIIKELYNKNIKVYNESIIEFGDKNEV